MQGKCWKSYSLVRLFSLSHAAFPLLQHMEITSLLLPCPATWEWWTVMASLLSWAMMEFAFLPFLPLGSYTSKEHSKELIQLSVLQGYLPLCPGLQQVSVLFPEGSRGTSLAPARTTGHTLYHICFTSPQLGLFAIQKSASNYNRKPRQLKDQLSFSPELVEKADG